MSSLTRWLRGPWGTPIASGLLIIVAATISLSAGVNPSGADHHAIGFVLDRPAAVIISDLLMITAALVAGIPIILKAVRALMVRTIAIDLLVSIAAVGALVIGEYWEAAAVTFLFAIGHALEAGPLDRPRRRRGDAGRRTGRGPRRPGAAGRDRPGQKRCQGPCGRHRHRRHRRPGRGVDHRRVHPRREGRGRPGVRRHHLRRRLPAGAR